MKTNKIIYLTLKLTNQCNLKCKMCGQIFSTHRNSKDEISIDKIEKMLKDIPSIKHLYLFGGEPLIYSKITELLKILKRRNISTRITTNGTLLSKYAECIVQNGVKDIEISLDSYKKEILNKIRGFDVFNSIISGINKLVEMKQKYNTMYPNISINCVILPDNYLDIERFVDYVENTLLGVKKINFEYPIITTKKQGEQQDRILRDVFNTSCVSWKWFYNSRQLFDLPQVLDIYKQIVKLAPRSIVSAKEIETYENLVDLLLNEYTIPISICQCPYKAITVLPNGDVTFCTDFPDVILGNIYDTNLKKIWAGKNSLKFREYLENKGSFPICGRCIHKDEKL